MNRYVSLLRGINVSGQKNVKMEDLRSLYESLGLKNVVTYVQSGNVMFESPNTKKTTLKEKIEKNIEARYHFYVPVEIRTDREVENILHNCPFGHIDIDKEGTTFLVTFLSSIPAAKLVLGIQSFLQPPEKLAVHGREVYLHCPNGYGKSKLTNNFLEQKLKVKATTRNWKTVSKLYELTK